MECKKRVCPLLSLSPLPSEWDASTQINHLGPQEWRLEISKGGEKHEKLESPKWLLLWLLLHKPLLLGVFAIATQSWLVLCHNDGYTKLKCLVQSHSWDPLYLPQFRDSLYLATTNRFILPMISYPVHFLPSSFFWGREGQNISLFSVLKTFRLSLNALSRSGPYFYLRWSSKPLKAILCSTKPHPHPNEGPCGNFLLPP